MSNTTMTSLSVAFLPNTELPDFSITTMSELNIEGPENMEEESDLGVFPIADIKKHCTGIGPSVFPGATFQRNVKQICKPL